MIDVPLQYFGTSTETRKGLSVGYPSMRTHLILDLMTRLLMSIGAGKFQQTVNFSVVIFFCFHLPFSRALRQYYQYTG